MSHPYKKLEIALWASLPGAITLALMLFYLIPKHISGLGNVMPLLPLIPVYFWGLHQRKEVPYWFVFLLGLIMDTVTGLPLGLTSLLYVFFLALLHAQFKYIYKEGFIIKWGYFAMLLGAMIMVNWLMLVLFYSDTFSLKFAIIQWLLTICIYPLFHMLFAALSERIAARRWKLEHVR
jgi:rod shape-determining protein MreD